MAALADGDPDPIGPPYGMGLIDELATADAGLTSDSGTIATWAARGWTIGGDRGFYLSGNLASMAPGLPYAVGIQHAFPGRQVIAYLGDGGFAMLMAEFLTAVKHKLPVKVVINNNNSLGQIPWEQMVLGYPKHGVRYPEPFADYAAFASANRALGIKVERSGDARAAISQALAHGGPAIVDVNVNPDEPPLPGKVEYQQAKKFAQAFLQGQPRKATIATTLFNDKIEQLRSKRRDHHAAARPGARPAHRCRFGRPGRGNPGSCAHRTLVTSARATATGPARPRPNATTGTWPSCSRSCGWPGSA